MFFFESGRPGGQGVYISGLEQRERWTCTFLVINTSGTFHFFRRSMITSFDLHRCGQEGEAETCSRHPQRAMGQVRLPCQNRNENARIQAWSSSASYGCCDMTAWQFSYLPLTLRSSSMSSHHALHRMQCEAWPSQETKRKWKWQSRKPLSGKEHCIGCSG